MTSFKEFHKKSEQLTEDFQKTGSIVTQISQNIQLRLSPMVGALSIFTTSEKLEKFSKEVANYATSDDLLSSISDQIGEPKENETEQEFVERASQILREVLKKKFKL